MTEMKNTIGTKEDYYESLEICNHMLEETTVKSCYAITNALDFNRQNKNSGQNPIRIKHKVRKRLCYAVCGLYSMRVTGLGFPKDSLNLL